jgi:hypothetical protein
MISTERLHELLRYEPQTGLWYWTEKASWKVAGKVAGNISVNDGYRRICVDRKTYKAARLAWFWMTGEWPPRLVDHKNLITGDDRWENLRLANYSENGGNTPVRSRNICGIKGVRKHRNKWLARIFKDGKNYHLGLFASSDEASAAYAEKAKELYGEFARAA